MKQCWRWFGPHDPVKLYQLHQVGVTGVVTALHDIPPGITWSDAQIKARKCVIESAGLDWTVVESLPVSETIKTKGTDYQSHISAYKSSMRALSNSGISTICYNFMPILDWTRTELRTKQPHGGTAMSFDLVKFAAFDLHILRRKNAKQDYDDQLQEAAKFAFDGMSSEEKQTLMTTIIMGLPGANDHWELEDVQSCLESYDDIDAQRLRQNFIDFLSEIIPLAEDLGLRMCCHPDDPPFNLLGLPRIMSKLSDYEAILNTVNSPSNGATFCTGSLGVSETFDPVEFINKLGSKIHFVHLRNTKRTASIDSHRPNFFEAAHLEGDTDMVKTVQALMKEQGRRKAEGRLDWEIPMRPDHGQELLSDIGGHSLPGYPLIGRMRGLAELRGIMAAHNS